jgi:hypothetical protein
VTAQAAIGAAKATPVSTAAAKASTSQPLRAAPKAQTNTVRIAQFIAIRMVMNIRCPRKMSAGRSGEACAPM